MFSVTGLILNRLVCLNVLQLARLTSTHSRQLQLSASLVLHATCNSVSVVIIVIIVICLRLLGPVTDSIDFSFVIYSVLLFDV
jgi:hypothetical protein